MNNLHLTAALATEHRRQLLREAEQYRLVRAAKTGPVGRPKSTRAVPRSPWLSRILARAGEAARPRGTATNETTVRSLGGRESDVVPAGPGRRGRSVTRCPGWP
jgi:hypothetical protein